MQYDSKSANVYAAAMAMIAGSVVLTTYIMGGVFLLTNVTNVGTAIAEQVRTGHLLYGWEAVELIGFMFVGMLLTAFAAQGVLWKVKSIHRREFDAMTPVLYQSENNGVTALVTREQYEAARAEYARQCKASGQHYSDGMVTLQVVPNAMVFCSDGHAYPININRNRTGNYADMQTLTAGCRVETRSLFVPFSSFVMGSKEWQFATFRPLSFGAARRLIEETKAVLQNEVRNRRAGIRTMVILAVIALAVLAGALHVVEPPVKFVLAVSSGLAAATLIGVARRWRSRYGS